MILMFILINTLTMILFQWIWAHIEADNQHISVDLLIFDNWYSVSDFEESKGALKLHYIIWSKYILHNLL